MAESEFHRRTQATFDSFGVDILRRGEVFDSETERLEQGDFLLRLTPFYLVEQDFANFAENVIVANRALFFREEEVARLIYSRLAPIHKQARILDGSRIQFARKGHARPDGIDMRAGGNPIAQEDWLWC
jgi:hypothetical protein